MLHLIVNFGEIYFQSKPSFMHFYTLSHTLMASDYLDHLSYNAISYPRNSVKNIASFFIFTILNMFKFEN